jgi:NitT/TauT family transport system permease protein
VSTARQASRIPSYLSPAPRRVLGLAAWQWTLLILVFAAGAIELVARAGVVSRLTLLPFTEMVVGAGRLLITGDFWTEAMLPSLASILTAFVIAGVVGVLAGYLIWRVKPLRRAMDPYLSAYYALPVFAIYPMLVAIWGQGTGPVTALAALFAVVAVILNAMNGFDSAPPIVAKLARSMGVGELTYFRKFCFPFALPFILIGLRLAFVYSLLTVLAAEFLLSNIGLGFFVNDSYVRFQVPDIYGSIIVIFLLAIGAERLITFAVRRLSWVGSLS